jgi:undecaprenyl-phosphate 4-deoxy-4-formamido-L-arabinose transferase
VLAGFEESRGAIVVTLDADLQNPPEEIPKLLAAIRDGNDVAGGWRAARQDPLFRRLASGVINRLTSKALGVRMKDYGCMLRAYRREVVDGVVRCGEASAFIPALANTFAKRIVEVPVAHEERLGSRSRYGLLRLVNLQFDLVTGFSHLPLKVISTTGILVALAGLGFGLFLLVRRLIVGPEVEGVFTLFAILFVLVGAQFLALGVLGEYVGRVYREVRRRPRFVVRKVWRSGEGGS